MHTNPFSATGYDLADLRGKIERKADSHEITSLRSNVDSLERSLREACAEIDGLRRRCEVLEESCAELIARYRQDNSQFGVGA